MTRIISAVPRFVIDIDERPPDDFIEAQHRMDVWYLGLFESKPKGAAVIELNGRRFAIRKSRMEVRDERQTH